MEEGWNIIHNSIVGIYQNTVIYWRTNFAEMGGRDNSFLLGGIQFPRFQKKLVFVDFDGNFLDVLADLVFLQVLLIWLGLISET